MSEVRRSWPKRSAPASAHPGATGSHCAADLRDPRSPATAVRAAPRPLFPPATHTRPGAVGAPKPIVGVRQGRAAAAPGRPRAVGVPGDICRHEGPYLRRDRLRRRQRPPREPVVASRARGACDHPPSPPSRLLQAPHVRASRFSGLCSGRGGLGGGRRLPVLPRRFADAGLGRGGGPRLHARPHPRRRARASA